MDSDLNHRRKSSAQIFNAVHFSGMGRRVGADLTGEVAPERMENHSRGLTPPQHGIA